MFARVSTIMGKPDRVDEVINFLSEPNPPGLEAMKGAYLLVNRKTGKILTITLWETEADMEASASVANRVRGRAAETAAVQPVVESFEVALQE